MELVLVRHFHSLGNEHRSNYHKYGDANVPLSEKGKMQAPETAFELDRILKEHGITKPEEVVFLTSPYARATQTAHLVAEHSQNPAIKGKNPTQQKWLREMSVGTAMDLTKAERKTLYPNHTEKYNHLLKTNPALAKYPYGETPMSRYQAVSDADIPNQMQEWKQRGVKLVVAVSHQININAVRAVLNDEHPDEIMAGKRMENGGILRFTMDEKGKFNVPKVEHGKYEICDLAQIADKEYQDVDSIPFTKIIRHQVLATNYSTGLLAPEEAPPLSSKLEIQTESPVTSYIENEMAREAKRIEQAKNPLPLKR